MSAPEASTGPGPEEGVVVWIVGRPASGKTLLAQGVVGALRAQGRPVLWLDSDDLRRVMTPQARFDEADRDAFYGTLAHLGELCVRGGVIAVISATAHRRAYRRRLRARAARFAEIYLVCSTEELERRDPKGLYAAVRRGEIQGLPGVDAPFEPPEQADLILDTSVLPPDATRARALEWLEARFGWDGLS